MRVIVILFLLLGPSCAAAVTPGDADSPDAVAPIGCATPCSAETVCCLHGSRPACTATCVARLLPCGGCY